MADRGKKVSFVLQCTEMTAAGDAAPGWRCALEEVSSGARQTVLTYESLIDGLASHGIALEHDKPRPAICSSCRVAATKARGQY